MTFDEIRTEVRRRIAEVTTTWWTDDEVDAAIWEGEDEFADACEWLERWQTIDLLEDRPYYDLRSVLRRDFLVLGPTFNETTNRWLIPITNKDLDLGDRRWEERTAEPEYCMVRGTWWLGLWPWKGSEQGTVKQYYKALPTKMSADTDEPGFHRTFHYGLVEYAVSDLLSQDNETDLALRAWKEYQMYEAGLLAYVQGRGSVPAVHGYSAEG
jgi:hypothetical protein